MNDLTVLLGLVAFGVAALVVGVRHGLRADAAYARDGVLHPVSVLKFSVLSVATLGIYSLLWVWKSWRWAQAHGRPEIKPFWRTVFVVFFHYPLFEEANARLGDRRLPKPLGMFAALLYFIWMVVDRVWTRESGQSPLSTVVFSLSFVCFLPMLIATNRANPTENGVLAANSRFSGHSWAAIACGLLLWGLLLYPVE